MRISRFLNFRYITVIGVPLLKIKKNIQRRWKVNAVNARNIK